MTTRRRIAVWLIGIAGCLSAAMVLLVLLFFNPNHYRPEAISYLEQKTGKKVEIERLSVTFFPKVTVHIDGFGVKSPPLFPPSYIVKVPRADAVLDSWALLHRKVVIRSLMLEGPEINLVSDPDGPWNFENPGANNTPSAFPFGVVSRVEIKRGQLIASNLLPSDAAGPVFLEAHDVSSQLENVNIDAMADPTSTTLDGQGTLQAGLLRFGSIEVNHLNSKIRLQERQVFFTEVKSEAYGGKATGEL